MCSKPIFCSKIALKGKTCSRLLKLQKVAPNAKSCSKVAEHNRDRPDFDVSLENSPRKVHFKKIGYTSLLPRRSQLSLTNGRGSRIACRGCGLDVTGTGFDVAGGKNNFA